MRRIQRNGRARSFGIVAFLGLLMAGACAFPPTAWAVDGGYGPTGGSGPGGVGTLGNVIVAQTVGPHGAEVTGWEGGTKISIFIPPGEFPNRELVQITSFVPNCKSFPGWDAIIGFAVSHALNGNAQGAFSSPVRTIVFNQKISPHALVLSGGCKALDNVVIGKGFVVTSLRADGTIAILIGPGGTGGGQNHSWWGGLVQLAI